MAEIESLFSECMLDLENHLQKEEQVLFPFTYQLMESQLTGSACSADALRLCSHAYSRDDTGT